MMFWHLIAKQLCLVATTNIKKPAIFAQWGEPEKALDALQHAWEIGDAGFVLMYTDQNLDPIRDQPRFISLLEKWKDPSKR